MGAQGIPLPDILEPVVGHRTLFTTCILALTKAEAVRLCAFWSRAQRHGGWIAFPTNPPRCARASGPLSLLPWITPWIRAEFVLAFEAESL
jgi:hypothetical protein